MNLLGLLGARQSVTSHYKLAEDVRPAIRWTFGGEAICGLTAEFPQITHRRPREVFDVVVPFSRDNHVKTSEGI